MKHLKKLMAALVLAGTLGTAGVAVNGCAYGGIAASGEWAVVTKNDLFLFGLLRKVYVCKITPQGVQSCMTAESP